MLPLITKLATPKNTLSTLIYHQVLPATDAMRGFELQHDEFDRQMAFISKNFIPFALEEALDRLSEGTLPRAAIAVTFDDGYSNNEGVALPILKRHKIPATFFIASDYLNGGIMWNDMVLESFRVFPKGDVDLSMLGLPPHEVTDMASRVDGAMKVLRKLKYVPLEERTSIAEKLAEGLQLPKDLMMTSDQVRNLAREGMEIGGHTLSHPILTKVSEQEAQHQIYENKVALESIIGRDLSLFAYPNGKPDSDYNADIVKSVRSAGYRYAVSTSHGVATQEVPNYEVPRYTPWRRNIAGFYLQLLKNYYNKPYFATG